MQQDSLDVREVVPFEMMSEDEDFMAYVKYSNERFDCGLRSFSSDGSSLLHSQILILNLAP